MQDSVLASTPYLSSDRPEADQELEQTEGQRRQPCKGDVSSRSIPKTASITRGKENKERPSAKVESRKQFQYYATNEGKEKSESTGPESGSKGQSSAPVDDEGPRLGQAPSEPKDKQTPGVSEAVISREVTMTFTEKKVDKEITTYYNTNKQTSTAGKATKRATRQSKQPGEKAGRRTEKSSSSHRSESIDSKIRIKEERKSFSSESSQSQTARAYYNTLPGYDKKAKETKTDLTRRRSFSHGNNERRIKIVLGPGVNRGPPKANVTKTKIINVDEITAAGQGQAVGEKTTAKQTAPPSRPSSAVKRCSSMPTARGPRKRPPPQSTGRTGGDPPRGSREKHALGGTRYHQITQYVQSCIRSVQDAEKRAMY